MIYTHIFACIYIYIEGEREGSADSNLSLSLPPSLPPPPSPPLSWRLFSAAFSNLMTVWELISSRFWRRTPPVQDLMIGVWGLGFGTETLNQPRH